jgi:hypothetical protein
MMGIDFYNRNSFYDAVKNDEICTLLMRLFLDEHAKGAEVWISMGLEEIPRPALENR